MTGPASGRLEVRLVIQCEIRPGLVAMEVAALGDPEARSTLWPGLRPPAPPSHPALPRHRAEVRFDGNPAWVEARPLGAPLGDLAHVLEPDAVAHALADACGALAALHAAGRTHGDLTARHVLVAVDGSVVVAGAGVRDGHPEGDLAAVVHLAGALGGAGLSLEVLPPDAEALAALLRTSTVLDEAGAHGLLARAARAAFHPVPDAAPVLQLTLAARPEGLLDEVGPAPDPLGESTGSPPEWSEPGDVTRDRPPGGSETTAGGPRPEAPRASRVEVLARVLALPPMAAPDRAGHAARSLAALLVREPPDAVPLPDEAPPPDPFVEAPRPAPDPPEAPDAGATGSRYGGPPPATANPMDLPPGVTPEQFSRWLTQEEVRRRLLASFRRIPPATTLLISAIVAVHLATGADDWLSGRIVGGGRAASPYDILLGSRSPEALVAWGANAHASVAAGEWWRLPASVFLHADVAHIGLNCVALFGLGRLCEAVFGPGRFLALFLASGLAGAALTHAGGTELSVGASGGVFGLMGAGVVFGRRFRKSLPPSVRPIFGRGLVPWILINVLIGFSVPRIDNLGHMGGLFGGALLAVLLGSPVIPGAEGGRRTPVVLAFLVALCLGWTLAGMVGHRF